MAISEVAQIGGGASLSAGTTYYIAPTQTAQTTDAAEANRAVTWRKTGNFTNLRVRISANTATLGSTHTLRAASADTALATSITALTTGEFTDSDTVSVADGDLVSEKIVVGTGGSLTAQYTGFNFTPTDALATVVPVSAVGLVSFSTASTTRYNAICGEIGWVTPFSTTPLVKAACTYRNLFCYVSANARSASTFKLQEATVDSATLSLSIGASTTGYFEDTDSDSIVSGAQVRFVLVTGTGTGSTTFQQLGVWSESTSNSWTYIASRNGTTGGTSTASATQYFAVTGRLSPAGSTRTSQEVAHVGGSVSELEVYVTTNARSTTSTLGIYKNGSASATISISVAAGTTGQFTDSDSESTALNDKITTYSTTGTGTGSLAWTHVCLLGTSTPPITRPSYRASGSFGTKPLKYRTGGSFLEKQLRIRQGGVWVNA
jgi:hypothetical protein